MATWNPVSRPVTLAEIAAAFNMSVDRVERMVARHRIDPAMRIGRLRLYGPAEVQRIHDLVEAEIALAPP
jgi:hypothetical protein